MPSLHDFDMDENLIHKVNSDYYDIITFPKTMKTKDCFSLFHVNLRSLSAHIDEMSCIHSIQVAPLVVLHCMLIKENLQHMIQDDISTCEDEFETIWIEIKNSKSQNVLCGCAYRHPNTNVCKFNDYINQTMEKISKENKLIFLIGDFNINLLNHESHGETNDFINTMISHYLLPRILHPTRVTDHSATVIDNIFSNNTSYETTSGNIITQISDHFPQFLILNKVTMDYKTCSFAKRDFSNFSEQRFVEGFATQNMDFFNNTKISLNSKFDLFYDTVSSYVDNHVPVKKINKKDLKLHSKPWVNPKIQ